jgi:hypothetical protein
VLAASGDVANGRRVAPPGHGRLFEEPEHAISCSTLLENPSNRIMASAQPVTRLLDALNRGEPEAMDELFALVYDELRRLVQAVRRGRSGETLNTTALVHEAYLKLAGSERLDVQSRRHFMRVAAPGDAAGAGDGSPRTDGAETRRRPSRDHL